MSVYDDRPWLARYGDQAADYHVEFDNALDMFRAGVAGDPSAVALTYFDGSITRQELDELSDGLASGLLANGFQPGDRLAVYLQNVPQFVIAMVAAWKAGGVMVSINPMSRQRELSYLLKDSGATVLVSLEALYDEIGRGVVPDTDVRLVLTTSELEFQTRNDERLFAGMTRRRHEGTTDFSEFIAEHRGTVPPPVQLGPDDVAFLTYTSGTTGVPKGAMNTHGNVTFTAQVYRDWTHAGRDGAIFGIAPLFHITGLIGHIAVSMLVPAPLILAYRFEPQRRPRRLRRAPAGLHDRRDHRVQRPAERARLQQGPLRVVHVDLLRRRGDLADRREGVPGGHRQAGAQRLRPHRDDLAHDTDAVRVAVPGRPDVRGAVGRRAGAEHDRAHPGRRRHRPPPR